MAISSDGRSGIRSVISSAASSAVLVATIKRPQILNLDIALLRYSQIVSGTSSFTTVD